MKCNQSRPEFELVSPRLFLTTITITPRPPPKKPINYNSFKNKIPENPSLTNHVCVCVCVCEQNSALDNSQGFICQ